MGWQLGGRTVDERLLPLLAAIAAAGSLAQAARACGISYRAGWDLLGRHAAAIGAPLVTLERGRGARITSLGTQLLAADARGRSLLDREVGALSMLPVRPRKALERASTRAAHPLRIAASHDLALERLLGGRHARTGAFELAFSNSLQALAVFARGDADVAGFHVVLPAEGDQSHRPFLTYLDSRRDLLIRFADRAQGLLVPPGNPRRITRLEQVAGRRLRFVTRQRGSGTRLLVESLLQRIGVRPGAIEGFGSQAPTHHAVAEAVATGRADVGFGLAAAARDHGLDFVPVTRERYFLAVRRAGYEAGATDALIGQLRGRRLARIAAALDGYDARAAGTIEAVTVLELATRR